MLLNCGVGGNSLSPLDCKEIKLVNPKRNQSWIFIGRTDDEAEALILWPLPTKNWFIRKDPDAGKDWRQKGTTEDEMVGWHQWLNGHEFEQVPGDGERPRSLVCCNPRGRKESDITEQLNDDTTSQSVPPWTEVHHPSQPFVWVSGNTSR